MKKSEKSPCLYCKHKNVYEPLTKCFVCNFSGIECKNFEMYEPKSHTNANCENIKLWKPIHCKYCGGALSEVREHNGRQYRHCYSCLMDYEEGKS